MQEIITLEQVQQSMYPYTIVCNELSHTWFRCDVSVLTWIHSARIMQRLLLTAFALPVLIHERAGVQTMSETPESVITAERLQNGRGERAAGFCARPDSHQSLDDDDELVSRVKDVKEVEKRPRHCLLPRNAWHLVELFVSCLKEELHGI